MCDECVEIGRRRDVKGEDRDRGFRNSSGEHLGRRGGALWIEFYGHVVADKISKYAENSVVHQQYGANC
jgi:hypothetical protein